MAYNGVLNDDVRVVVYEKLALWLFDPNHSQDTFVKDLCNMLAITDNTKWG